MTLNLSKKNFSDDLIIIVNRFCTALLGGNGRKDKQKQENIHDKTSRPDTSL